MKPARSPDIEPLVYEPSKVSWAAVELIRAPPPYVTLFFLVALTLGAMVGATYTYFAEVAVAVEANGTLVSERQSFVIASVSTSRVSKLFVAENQKVTKGDVLVLTDNQITDESLNSVKTDVAKLSKFVERDRAGNCDAVCLLELTEFSRKAFDTNVPGVVKESLLQMQELVNSYTSAMSGGVDAKKILSEQYRQIDVAKKKLALIHHQKVERLLGPQVEQLQREIGTLQGQVAERQLLSRRDLEINRDKLEVRLHSLLATLQQFRSQQAIVAPVDGTVSKLDVSGAGQGLNAGQKLMELIPANSPLVAEIWVANRDISRISPTLPATIYLEAFPERDFGALRGKVTALPSNVEATAESPAAQANYKVRLSIDRQEFEKDQVKYPFRLGMSLRAVVVTKREKMIRVIARKILNTN